MTDHASDAYLAGLSDDDRARAVIAVRWDDARWVPTTIYSKGKKMPQHLRCLVPDTSPAAEASLPIDQGMIPRYAIWGTSWAGTAALMELAEAKGWWWCHIGDFGGWFDVTLTRGATVDDAHGHANTIHAAVLLACAEVAQMEANTPVGEGE